jgi:hypothetical protein
MTTPTPLTDAEREEALNSPAWRDFFALLAYADARGIDDTEAIRRLRAGEIEILNGEVYAKEAAK